MPKPSTFVRDVVTWAKSSDPCHDCVIFHGANIIVITDEHKFEELLGIEHVKQQWQKKFSGFGFKSIRKTKEKTAYFDKSQYWHKDVSPATPDADLMKIKWKEVVNPRPKKIQPENITIKPEQTTKQQHVDTKELQKQCQFLIGMQKNVLEERKKYSLNNTLIRAHLLRYANFLTTQQEIVNEVLDA